ncbi:MAG: glycosyltransferase family 39 protein [Acidimicrobiales bacterium]
MDDLPATRTQGDDVRPDWRYLSVLLIAAAVLRLYRLSDDSLWYDEILSERRATAPLNDAHDLLRNGTHPPGYSQAILRPWLALGNGEWMQRFPSVVFGVTTVAMTAVLGTRLAGRRAGLAAAALLAVMPLHLYYSREGRMYALLALVLLGWVMALIRARERDTTLDWTVYALLGAASLYTHYYAGFTVLAVVGTTAVLEFRHGFTTRSRRWLIATLGIGMLFAPWLPTFQDQLNNDPVSHLQPLTLDGLIALPVQFFTGFVERSTADSLVVGVTLAALLVFGSLRLRSVADGSPDAAFAGAVVGAALVGTGLLSIAVSELRPLVFVRYFVGVLPFLAILIGAALTRLRPVPVIAFSTLFAVATLHAVPTINDAWRPAFRDATDRIEQDHPDDVIVVSVGPAPGDFRATGLRYYLDNGYVLHEYAGSVRDQEFPEFLDELRTTAPRTWILQYRHAHNFNTPPGFIASANERYETRFFETRYMIQITALDREDQ